MECLRKHLAYKKSLNLKKQHEDDSFYYFRDGPLSLELDSEAKALQCQRDINTIETQMSPACLMMHKVLVKLNL